MARSIENFRALQGRIQLGVTEKVAQFHADEQRQRMIEIELAEYEARKVAELERIEKAKRSNNA